MKLHITTSTSSHTLTILLSTPNGFKALTPITFTPEYIGGTFYVGDFEVRTPLLLCKQADMVRLGKWTRWIVLHLSNIEEGNPATALHPVRVGRPEIYSSFALRWSCWSRREVHQSSGRRSQW